MKGRAAHPVYLWVHDDDVELRDARPLWGELTGSGGRATSGRNLADSQVRVAQIGPAGENLVRFACIVHDLNEVAGRTGLGAVMGSKNLKAIAVRGTQPVIAAAPRAIAGVARWVAQETLAPGKPHHRLHTWGTGAMVKSKQLEGHLAAHNFRDGRLPGGDQVDALAVQDLAEHEMDRCYACSVRCKKRVKITRPDLEVDPKYGGPEYETMAAIGPNTGVIDVMAVCKGHEMLNALGMDSISCGATIAWAMEMVELGLMDEHRLNGETLHFGSADDLLRVIGKIARREGVGDLLAEGSLRAARTLGADAEARVVHVKGLEVAMHDPRAMPEMRRNYPVTPTGGDHTGAAGKRSGLRNTVGLCHFLQYDEATTLTLLNASTGWEVSPDELHATFERGITMARLFNLREGLKPGRRPSAGPPAPAVARRAAARPSAQPGLRQRRGASLLSRPRVAPGDRAPICRHDRIPRPWLCCRGRTSHGICRRAPRAASGGTAALRAAARGERRPSRIDGARDG